MEFHSNYTQSIPKGLSSLAGVRDLITTSEFALIFNIQPQTDRKNYCLSGEVYGIKPTKIGSRLLWPVTRIEEKLREAV